jgi:hypothetical protein
MLGCNGSRAPLGLVLAAAVCAAQAVSCGGDSNSVTDAAGGKSSQSGSGSSSAGSDSTRAGSSAHGGSGNVDAGGSGAQTGNSGSPSTGGGDDGGSGAGECPAKESWTEAMHVVIQVTWPATLAAAAGSGKAELWSRTKVKANGNDLSGEVDACGLVLPETVFSAAGALATGGKKFAVDAPDSVWEGKHVPVTTFSGTQSGYAMGSTIQQASVALQGVTLADPKAAWPASGTDLETFDFDDDTFPGWTAVARNGGGYVLPPTAIGLVGSAPSTDKVYTASRATVALNGKRTACDAHSGPADASIDYHVVGCHIMAGDKQCDAAQTDFQDQQRMVYVSGSATYEAKTVPDAATCADVRAAFPHK